MLGVSMMCETPSKASTANHTIMIGPNTLPIAPVPLLCTAKRATRMHSAMGMTQSLNEVDTSPSPSTAASTEIAGVITPSP